MCATTRSATKQIAPVKEATIVPARRDCADIFAVGILKTGRQRLRYDVNDRPCRRLHLMKHRAMTARSPAPHLLSYMAVVAAMDGSNEEGGPGEDGGGNGSRASKVIMPRRGGKQTDLLLEVESLEPQQLMSVSSSYLV